MSKIIFRSMADSAYLWTAMMAADEKGVAYELEPLILYSEEHFRLHPFGKMPVMQHGEAVLYETLAIAHYIDRAFPGPALQPLDPLGQAQMLRWISIVNAYVYPVMNRFTKERLVKPAWGFDSDEAFLASAREPLELQVRLIAEAAARGRYLAGDRMTLADLFLLPHLLFFSRSPEGGAMLAEAPGAADWMARMRARPSYAASPMRLAFDVFHELPGPTEPLWAAA